MTDIAFSESEEKRKPNQNDFFLKTIFMNLTLTKVSVLFNLKYVLISRLITYSTTNSASAEERRALQSTSVTATSLLVLVNQCHSQIQYKS